MRDSSTAVFVDPSLRLELAPKVTDNLHVRPLAVAGALHASYL